MRSNIVTEASLSTRINQWWTSIPFVTAAVLALCVGVYVAGLLIGYDSFLQVCLSPLKLVSEWQVYRPWTSIIFHNGILHIVFNMLAFVPMGGALERQLGSVRYAYLLLLFAATNALFNTLVAYAVAYSPIAASPKLLYECGIGFSGVIFALIVVETHINGVQNRSIFGFFTVPAKWYPWALLILFQLLMPAVSLVGHLSGIVSGLAYCYGALNAVLPSSATCNAVESSSLLAWLTRRPNFILGGSAGSGALPTVVDSARSASRGSRSASVTATAANAWRSLQSLVANQQRAASPAQGPGEEDSRFPGQGRTLARPSASATARPSGLETGPPPAREVTPGTSGGVASGVPGKGGPAGHCVGGKAAPQHSTPKAAAAAAAASRAARGGLPQDSFHHLQQQPQQQQQPPRPAQSGSLRALPGGRQPLAAGSDGALGKLLAMGYEEGAARSALAAANGDLTLAVDFLSA